MPEPAAIDRTVVDNVLDSPALDRAISSAIDRVERES